jgi:hypothetical protein
MAPAGVEPAHADSKAAGEVPICREKLPIWEPRPTTRATPELVALTPAARRAD